MPDLRGALDDLALIREQVAKSSQFEGLGPMTLSATGILALVVAAMQSMWLKDARGHPSEFLATWYATAAISVVVIGIEVLIRSRRVHGSMAVPMMQQAAKHFCPALVAGGLLTIALMRADPTASWLLPGLWEIIFSFGAFAMAPMLPKPMFAVGLWYLMCGLVCVQRGLVDALSGWTMGIPFGVGQLMVAAILIAREHVEFDL
jgi:hypothetical protein